jgi:hypothetical protein
VVAAKPGGVPPEEPSSTVPTSTTTDLIFGEDVNETKSKLRELMLQEKVSQLEKQLAKFSTLPLTKEFYETVQLNSCNVDDLVLAVYVEEYGSYKIIHKTSNYLHFVHSAILKNYEQRLSFKSAAGTPTTGSKPFPIDQSQMTEQDAAEFHTSKSPPDSSMLNADASLVHESSSMMMTMQNSPPGDNPEAQMFFNDRQLLPQWFVGKVILKEFCVARKVIELNFIINNILGFLFKSRILDFLTCFSYILIKNF